MCQCFAGIDGIKIKIFSTSMDTKGREELLGMQSCQSYQGCPVCLHSWTPGRVLGRKQVVCDGYRCFLHADSAARQKSFTFQGGKYEFRTIERREVPRTRDDSFVRRAVGVASENKPFCGHKTAPLLCMWPGYSWYRMNVPEIMHGAYSPCPDLTEPSP